MHSKRKRRTILVALLAFVLATAAYAFTATNTFNGGTDAGKAGDGSGVISGYDVTNIHYDLNDGNPTTLDSVSFTLNSSAAEVRARVNAGTWVLCGGGPLNFTCNITGTSTQAANSLQVAAAS